MLADYEIADRTTLRDFKIPLLSLELPAGNDAAALALTAEIQGLEEKPPAKVPAGLPVDPASCKSVVHFYFAT